MSECVYGVTRKVYLCVRNEYGRLHVVCLGWYWTAIFELQFGKKHRYIFYQREHNVCMVFDKQKVFCFMYKLGISTEFHTASYIVDIRYTNNAGADIGLQLKTK